MKQPTKEDWELWNKNVTEEELEEARKIMAKCGTSAEVAKHIVAGDKWVMGRWWSKEDIEKRSLN